jgi:hypothetical protein|nr:MAG TPA: hypothetical protein [Caudoviricetes sp.]
MTHEFDKNEVMYIIHAMIRLDDRFEPAKQI